MKKYPVDLHLHTTASDGKFTPAEVIRNAAARGMKVVSITDHDTIGAYSDRSVFILAEQSGIELVSGIEFSCYMGARSVHILGYFIDTDSEELHRIISMQKSERELRMRRMVDRLREMGMDRVSFDEIMKDADHSVGRPHLARHLMNKGYCREFTEAFEKYIGEGRPAYVKRDSIPPEKIISLIKDMGGISVVAHPRLIEDDGRLNELVMCGLDGIEVVCPAHNRSDEARYNRFAEKHGLIRTGGSDFHGTASGDPIGTSGMSYEDFLRIRR